MYIYRSLSTTCRTLKAVSGDCCCRSSQMLLSCGRDALLRAFVLGPEVSHSTCLGLLQRLHSHLAAATSSSSTQQQQLRSSQPTQCSSSSSQQQQQQWTRQTNSSSLLHQQTQPWSFTSSRGYADDAGAGSFGRRRRGLGSRGQVMGQGYRERQQQFTATVDPQQLGRRPALCDSTETLHEYDWQRYWPGHPEYNPFRDDRQEVIKEVPGDELDALLLMRQQVENSALPSELKRSELITGPGWDELLLNVKRTVKVTKGGKVETLHAMVAVGNGDGLIGIGEHSGKNIQKVVMDAQLKAYRNVVAIPRYRQHTVYHSMDIKNRTVRMQIWPRKSGFGLTASPLITQLCDLVGLRDASVKVTGRRRNLRTVVHTFVEGLLGQSVPHDGVEGSGVYMREVFYSNQLPCGLKRGVHVP